MLLGETNPSAGYLPDRVVFWVLVLDVFIVNDYILDQRTVKDRAYQQGVWITLKYQCCNEYLSLTY